MKRIALVLEYDGRGFCGWQSQATGDGVQDALEQALSVVADTPVRVHCAGRTDSGVHALAQVVHFDTEAVRPVSAWVRGVNSNLPERVAVLAAHEVDERFHARFSATGRHYRYPLLNRSQRPGLAGGRVGWFHRPLDLGAMQKAAGFLLGEHDFSAFRAAECQAQSPVRILHRLSIQRDGHMLSFDVHANAFLHHMVRNLVGALVYVGCGRRAPEWLGEVLAGRVRAAAAPTFSAAGLYLTGVDYDPPWDAILGAGGTASEAARGLP